jgi:diguanylate cyclase (GGDEF)-like protein/PAS domain S-box-containing protein
MNPPEPLDPTAPQGRWGRFRQQHLFDYTPAALRLWLAIVFCGLLVAGWAVFELSMAPASAELGKVAIGLALVAAAALFPVQIPRTPYTVLVADGFVLAILATLGAPAAVLAAGTEALIGALRSSKRLSSHLSAPTAAMTAMAGCAAAFAALQAQFVSVGVGPEAAALAALCLASLVQVVLTTVPMMAIAAAKRGRMLDWATWLGGSSWFAGMVLAEAFIAGLVHLNAQRFGVAVIGVAAAVAFALVVLARFTLARHDTERRKQEARVAEAEREAQLNQQRFIAAFTHAAIGMAIVRPDGRVVQVNDALCSLLGRSGADELIGCPFTSLLHAGDVELFKRRAGELPERAESAFSMELRCVAADGDEVWVTLHCSRYQDPGAESGAGGAGSSLIYQLHDITSRHIAESRLHHIAYHDGLTDLANRNCFHERLGVAVERSRLDPTVRFAVMFLDLDRFKVVNDSLGHIAGNVLLREVAQRLRACLRPTDLVARLGGDEFAVLLEQLHDAEQGLRLAERVLQALQEPAWINGCEVLPGASVGITFSDLGYRTADEVLRDADLAMYEAKGAGRGRVALFDSSMHERVAEKLALEADLRHAIGEGQLAVHFQPLYRLDPYELYGFEALVRWTHPQRGPISPAVFIGLAEETGHVEALTSWVIDHAVGQLGAWHKSMPAMAHLGMHVNISGRDMARSDLAQVVGGALARHAVAADRLTLEITETTLMGRLDTAVETMRGLRETGVRFSIDDFGTGYSSLAYLSTLPIDSLKIDRSFVMALHDKPQHVEIVRAVCNLGQSLGRKVVAEGIETAEQLATLRELGVPIGQGYLLSRPLRAEQVTALLALADTARVAPALPA